MAFFIRLLQYLYKIEKQFWLKNTLTYNDRIFLSVILLQLTDNHDIPFEI